MKKWWSIYIAGLGLALVLISATSVVEKQHSNQTIDEIEIAIRQIGHTVLLQAGDSSSRVLPVQHLNPSTFLLTFQSPFSFIPDSLVKIVKTSISKTNIRSSYRVNVRDCAKKEIIYGFKIGLKETTTLIPCLGREQNMGCYQIEISFETTDKATLAYWRLAMMTGFALLIVSVILLLPIKKKPALTIDENTIKIGKYFFSAHKGELQFGTEHIELSDKETKLLRIFASKMNEPITREQLLKEGWEDEGVIVGRSLDVFISKLRKKLAKDPSVLITNIHGKGYVLQTNQN